MFTLANWQNPETLMLNITNSALGLVIVAWMAWIIYSVIHDSHQSHSKKISHLRGGRS